MDTPNAMDPERWRRVDRLYNAALAQPAAGREAFLRDACGNDQDVREEVLSLLAQPQDTWTSPVPPPPGGAPQALIGRRIGVYQIQALVGAGGMGEVYRARDTRLGRDVAIKILPREWMADSDRVARLEREARALASLNHPNIATIHGLEEDGGIRALVLELVEGATLAERILAGPIAVPEAVGIARQIANALDAAHEKGIVHRDLKPANIKIMPAGVVKVLDFGLAKLDPAPGGPRGESPTLTVDRTHPGTIAGTAAYMSPEQARGQAVDKRTDVWAFGCVLYEMLTGRSAFGRATPTDTLAAVIHAEPDWNALPSATPPEIRRLLQRCLEKDVRRRLRDIGDAETDAMEAPVAASGSPRWWMAVAAAALMTVAVAALMIAGFRARSTGTEDASGPFWSPDGRFIGFAADGRLKKIDADTGTLQTVCVCVTELLGGTWGASGVIVFAPVNRSPLHRVAASGGTAEPLTTLDTTRNENSHRWPHFLPDGRHLLYTARSDVTSNTGVYLMDLETGTRQWLLEAQSQAMHVPSGHLLFVRDGTLLAQPFDIRTNRLSGEPSAVAGAIDHNATGAAGLFAASVGGGVLAYRGGFQLVTEVVRFDRAGVRQGVLSEEAGWQDLELSPDGTRVALVRSDPVSGNRDIWLLGVATGYVVRWSTHPANDWHPVWSPDGRHLAFASDRNGASAVFRRAVDGGDEDRLVMPALGSAAGRFPDEWSRDDRIIVLQDHPTGTTELWSASASGGDEPHVLKQAGRISGGGRVSPDGRWLAYVSDESGTLEVYASPLDGSSKHRVSTAGGVHPRWHRDGRELLYLGADNALMSVAVEPGASFTPPKRLFTSCLTRQPPHYWGGFELADDGTTLWLCPGRGAAAGIVTVTVGWSPERASGNQ